MKFNIENLKDVGKLVKELSLGLQRLAFSDNFEGFEANLTIPASSEGRVRNQLNFVPSKYIILSQEGNGLVTKSSTAWNLNYIYFQNHGAAEVSVTIYVMR